MSDAAFTSDWNHISTHLFVRPNAAAGVVAAGLNDKGPRTSGGAQDVLSSKLSIMSKTVLEEAKRILRLCLHKNVKICSDAQHERSFCIFCAIATKHTQVWEAFLGRLAERRMTTLRIPQAGEYNLNEVKKFIRVACVTLSLKTTEAPPCDDSDVAAAGRKRSRAEAEVPISSDEASLLFHGSAFDKTTVVSKQSKATKTRGGVVQRRTNEPAYDGVDDDSEDGAPPTSLPSFAIRTRDWDSLVLEASQLYAELPTLTSTSPGVAALLGCVGGQSPSDDDGSVVCCGGCGERIGSGNVNGRPPSKHQVVVLKCVRCAAVFHRACLVPATLEVQYPFVCTECRILR